MFHLFKSNPRTELIKLLVSWFADASTRQAKGHEVHTSHYTHNLPSTPSPFSFGDLSLASRERRRADKRWRPKPARLQCRRLGPREGKVFHPANPLRLLWGSLSAWPRRRCICNVLSVGDCRSLLQTPHPVPWPGQANSPKRRSHMRTHSIPHFRTHCSLSSRVGDTTHSPSRSSPRSMKSQRNQGTCLSWRSSLLLKPFGSSEQQESSSRSPPTNLISEIRLLGSSPRWWEISCLPKIKPPRSQMVNCICCTPGWKTR